MSLPVLLAGAAYFAIVFAAGFILGTLRVLIVAPQVGQVAAVALEVPVMLVVAWFACGWAVGKVRVPRRTLDRIVMGVFALALLLIAEAFLSVTLVGLTLQEHFRSYAQAAPLIGLAAQLLYAGFPVLQSRTREGRAGA